MVFSSHFVIIKKGVGISSQGKIKLLFLINTKYYHENGEEFVSFEYFV